MKILNLRNLSVAFLCLAFLTSGCQKEIERELSQPDPNAFVSQTEDYNLFSEDKVDQIVLYVEEDEKGMPLAWTLVINGLKRVEQDFAEGWYSQAKFDLYDIDGDGFDELLFYRFSTGSAGAQALNVYKITNNTVQQLFYAENSTNFGDEQGYQVQYEGDYEVSVRHKSSGMNAIISLDAEDYKGLEEMLEGISTWIDPISEYRFEDLDLDGISEIISVQRVIGVAHPDTIARLETVYQFTGESFEPIALVLTNNSAEIIARVDL